jgi:DNA invertase Pin-like site-specific DNA recombinase
VLIHAYLHRTELTSNLADLKNAFETFALRKGQRIGAFYNDQEVPAAHSSLFRLLRDKGVAIASQGWLESRAPYEPSDELFRLLGQARPNDVLLIESAGLLSRLSANRWHDFRKKIKQRKIRIVALDVESSWVMISGESAMAPTAEKLTNMMLDMLEALALKERRGKRNRHLEGIARAKAQGKYRGRPVDQKKHERILGLLQDGHSWSEICAETGASRSTVARVVKSGN